MDQMKEWMDRTHDALSSAVGLERAARAHPALQPLAAVETVLVGLESFWLGSIVGQLVARGATDSAIHDYVRDRTDSLPLYGCEQEVFDTLIAALRTRGYDDAAIAEVIDTMIGVVAGGRR